MRKIFIMLVLFGFVLVANQDNSTVDQATNCMGGACSVDSIKSKTIFNSQGIFGQEGDYNPKNSYPSSSEKQFNLPSAHDQDCQFGTCITPPSDSK